MMEIPNGRLEINQVYGNPDGYLNNKEAWERDMLATRSLKYPLLWAYSSDKIMVSRIKAHKNVVDLFVECLAKCVETGLPADRMSYGGIYAWRPKRSGISLSTHTWGIAVDIDPIRNKWKRSYDKGLSMIHPKIIRIFVDAGARWGGEFPRPDCMHFQFCKGY